MIHAIKGEGEQTIYFTANKFVETFNFVCTSTSTKREVQFTATNETNETRFAIITIDVDTIFADEVAGLFEYGIFDGEELIGEGYLYLHEAVENYIYFTETSNEFITHDVQDN